MFHGFVGFRDIPGVPSIRGCISFILRRALRDWNLEFFDAEHMIVQHSGLCSLNLNLEPSLYLQFYVLYLLIEGSYY